MGIYIDTISRDLLTRVKTVSAFTNRVGFTVGNQEGDPYNLELPKPFSWIVYLGDDLVNAPNKPCSEQIKLNYIVKIAVEYGRNESDLLDTTFPILHETVQAIRGGEPVLGSYWLYEGQVIEEFTDRLVFAQSYSITIGI